VQIKTLSYSPNLSLVPPPPPPKPPTPQHPIPPLLPPPTHSATRSGHLHQKSLTNRRYGRLIGLPNRFTNRFPPKIDEYFDLPTARLPTVGFKNWSTVAEIGSTKLIYRLFRPINRYLRSIDPQGKTIFCVFLIHGRANLGFQTFFKILL
jgi:hypothetical protein